MSESVLEIAARQCQTAVAELAAARRAARAATDARVLAQTIESAGRDHVERCKAALGDAERRVLRIARGDR